VSRYLEGYTAGLGARSLRPSALPQPVAAPAPAVTFEERTKRELHPLDAFPRLLACADANLPPEPGDRFRFEWFGLSYLAPERDGFRLRLRAPGGVLRTYQMREVAELARVCGSGCVEINERADLDISVVNVVEAPEALRLAEAAGFSTRGCGGDQVLAILMDPMAGIAPGQGLDVTPYAVRLEQCIHQGREFADLPGPCVISLSGDQSADIRLAASNAGFRLGAGSLRDLGTWLRADQAVHACVELLRLYLREADRSDRQRARFSSCFAAWDGERFLAALEQALGTKLPRETSSVMPVDAPSSWPARGFSAWPQKQPGLHVAAIAAPTARWLSADWEALAQWADLFGAGRVRLTASGAALIPSVISTEVEPLRAAWRERFPNY
jgi:ferredoxin-nitrite reductase